MLLFAQQQQQPGIIKAGSTDEFEIASFVADTGGGTQSFTHASIANWRAAVIFASGATSAAGVSSHGRLCTGFLINNGDAACVGRAVEDGDQNNQARQYVWDAGNGNACISIAVDGSSSAVDAEASFSSASSDGFTLTWDTTPGAAYLITVLFIGGSTNVSIGQHGSGVKNIGYEADIVFTASYNASAGAPSVSNDYVSGFGAVVNASGGIQQAAFVGEWDRLGDPTETEGIVYNNRGAGEIEAGVDNGIDFTAFGATSFTTVSDGGSPNFVYLAIELSDTDGEAAVAVETLPLGSGVRSFTALGISPSFIIGSVSLIDAENTRTTDGTAGTDSLFMANDEEERCYSAHHEQGINIDSGGPFTNTGTSARDTALGILDDTGTEVVTADSFTPISGGFSLDFSANAAGRMVVFGFTPPSPKIAVNETVNISESVHYVRGLQPTQVDESIEISESVYQTKLSILQNSEGNYVVSQPGMYAGRVSGGSLESEPG